MRIEFTKMEGLGNDFVVIDAIDAPVSLTAEQVRHLADRRRGVGCDQVLVVEPARGEDADLRYRIYNADGDEVEQCGNGARCVARFARDRGLAGNERIVAETLAGPVALHVLADGQVTVDMGVPRLEPREVPFEGATRASHYELAVDGREVEIGVASMGNPHAVVRVPDVEAAPVETLGAAIERHPRFPARANVGFMEVVDRGHVRLRVHERGVGETLACGTGACAAVVVGRDQGLLDERVSVDLPGGRLVISWNSEGEPVWMTGPAQRVFEGRIDL